MAEFSEKSKKILATCHPKLIALCNTAIMKFDFSVTSGHRGEKEQNRAFDVGNSHLRFPHSKHNKEPSMAVDLAPYPIDWEDTGRFKLLAGYLLGISIALEIDIRWGGDWDMDNRVDDEKWRDLAHFELIE